MHQQNEPSESTSVQHKLVLTVERFMTPEPIPTSKRGTELLQTATSLSLQSGLAASSWGEGPMVPLAHGWQSRRTHWAAFIPALVEAGMQVIAVDAPAHGESPGKQTNMFAYGLALLRTGQELGPLAAVVGHSFGAGAAVIALHRGLAAERAVFISGPASVRRLIEQWGLKYGLLSDEIPKFVQMIEERVGGSVESIHIGRLAAKLERPALIVHDRSDKDIPVDEGMAVAAAWPKAKLLVTERYGHRRIMIASEVVRAVVRFLRTG